MPWYFQVFMTVWYLVYILAHKIIIILKYLLCQMKVFLPQNRVSAIKNCI